MLFSPVEQALYELDEFTAHVWTRLQSGASRESMLLELANGGFSRDKALVALDAALDGLRALPISVSGLAERDGGTGRFLSSLGIEVAGTRVDLQLPDLVRADALPFLRHLRSQTGDSAVPIEVQAIDSKLRFLQPGKESCCCEASEFLPTLKAELIDAVLAHASYEIALHAAGLVRGDNLVLLVGKPGAGKSTLALALMQGGWLLDADDVMLLGADGLARGLAFPLTAKPGSWPIIAREWPGVTMTGEHRRPDGIAVRYVIPAEFAQQRPRSVDGVVLLNRVATGKARIEEVDSTSALAALLADADSRTHRLTSAGFHALVDLLGRASCCRLTYSHAPQAAEVLSGSFA